MSELNDAIIQALILFMIRGGITITVSKQKHIELIFFSDNSLNFKARILNKQISKNIVT